MPDPSLIRFEEIVQPGASWSHVLKRGTTLRIVDTDGGANVSALFYNFELPSERINLPDTLKCQHTARLTAGGRRQARRVANAGARRLHRRATQYA